MSNLASYFDERLILFLEASNQKAALKQLIEPLYELKKIEDPVFFLEKVEANLTKDFKDIFSNFLFTVSANNRFSVINSILEFFLDKSDKYLSIARAVVYSTHPLSKNSIDRKSVV